MAARLWSPCQRRSGLAPGQTYHFKLIVTNSVGTGQGQDAQFTVGAAPGAATTASSSSTTTDLTLNGGVSGTGGLDTHWYFQWGPDLDHMPNDAPAYPGADVGTTPQGVSTVLHGLQPGTQYCYRLVAYNAAGVTVAHDAGSGDAGTNRGMCASTAPNPAPPTGSGSTGTGTGSGSTGTGTGSTTRGSGSGSGGLGFPQGAIGPAPGGGGATAALNMPGGAGGSASGALQIPNDQSGTICSLLGLCIDFSCPDGLRDMHAGGTCALAKAGDLRSAPRGGIASVRQRAVVVGVTRLRHVRAGRFRITVRFSHWFAMLLRRHHVRTFPALQLVVTIYPRGRSPIVYRGTVRNIKVPSR